MIATPVVVELLETISPGFAQVFPVSIEGDDAEHFILNVPSRAALDRSRTQADWWQAEDNRPDKLGQPRAVYQLAIDPDLKPGEMFRVAGWSVALVASETVKQRLETARVTGVVFQAC